MIRPFPSLIIISIEISFRTCIYICIGFHLLLKYGIQAEDTLYVDGTLRINNSYLQYQRRNESAAVLKIRGENIDASNYIRHV